MKGITRVLAAILIVLMTVGAAGTFFVWYGSIADEAREQAEEVGLEIVSIDFNCDLLRAEVFVRNTGDSPIVKRGLDIYINQRPASFVYPDRIEPGGVGNLTVPLMATQKFNDFTVSYNYEHRRRIEWPCKIFSTDISRLALVAHPNNQDAHWPVFDYKNMNYSFYQSTDGDLAGEDGPLTGDVRTVTGRKEFTVQRMQTSWDERNYSTPIILVENPKPEASRPWTFNWTDPHGQFNFTMPGIPNAQQDYLIFWEDLYNPFDTHSLDDWKDHVVRISFVPPDTYRIAVYLAKGGYKHDFYLLVSQQDPLQGENPYNKSGGAVIQDRNGPWHTEAKVYQVQVT
ncbi:MAG: hypothetical protein SVW02_03180 [Candidatus Nanohaloarchaea archaeon]|nr:hypothetical protein [Candidatus Nanohaloarchaea archaeon]